MKQAARLAIAACATGAALVALALFLITPRQEIPGAVNPIAGVQPRAKVIAPSSDASRAPKPQADPLKNFLEAQKRTGKPSAPPPPLTALEIRQQFSDAVAAHESGKVANPFELPAAKR